MSRLDALPADQQAVLQLLLRQGKAYGELSGLLRLEDAAVRERAYGALDGLGPGAGGLDAERRHELADWLLGQQEPEDAAATRAYLEGSPAGRAWARAVAAELEPLAGERVPSVPGDGADDGAARPTATTPLASGPNGRPRVSRRGGALLIGGALAAIVAAVLAIVLIGGGDDKGKSATTAASTAATTQPQVKAQVNLMPPKGAPAQKALGIVQIVDVSGQQAINAVVQGLPQTKKAGYGIWLYAGPSKEKWLGYFQSTDSQGRAVAQGALNENIGDYSQMLVTRESRRDPPQPGTVYLSGAIQAR